MSDETKRHEKSAELIAASNAYYKRFANKLLDLQEAEPTADERHLAELLLSDLTAKQRLEVARLLRKKSVRPDMLHRCMVEIAKA